MCIPKALLFASALALFGCHEWLHGEPTIAPDPPPPTVGFGTDRDTGGNTIVVDGAFSKSPFEVAQGLQNSRRKYVVLDVRHDATWHSVGEAFEGARNAGMATVRVRREGAAGEVSLRSTFGELEGGWLTLEIAADAVKARTWPIEGAPGVTDNLPNEPSRVRAWLEHHCGPGRCAHVVLVHEASALAARGLEVASAVFGTWPFSVAPVTFLIGTQDGAPALEFTGAQLPPEMIQLVVRDSFWRLVPCHQRAIAKQPELTGTIRVGFKILPSGRVTEVGDGSATSSVGSGPPIMDKDMKACVFEVFAGFRFPIFEGKPITIVYPIMFSPAPPPKEQVGKLGTAPN